MNEISNDWVDMLARQLAPRLRREFESKGTPSMPGDIAERLERLRRVEIKMASSNERTRRPE